MNGTTHFLQPLACTARERREFARLVRQGFAGSDEELPDRIRHAKWLAFYYTASDTLAAIAGLKAPEQRYRDDVFKQAEARINPTEYRLELGWVFVAPDHRSKGIATSLCRQLLAREPTSHVFATTRPDNSSMINILRTIGFARVGRPYPHRRRNEELVLCVTTCSRSVAQPR